jgi:hypothetical protein
MKEHATSPTRTPQTRKLTYVTTIVMKGLAPPGIRPSLQTMRPVAEATTPAGTTYCAQSVAFSRNCSSKKLDIPTSTGQWLRSSKYESISAWTLRMKRTRRAASKAERGVMEIILSNIIFLTAQAKHGSGDKRTQELRGSEAPPLGAGVWSRTDWTIS